ncbi:DUF1127 domain-containing protein [Celeribacter marinus]|uniref:YjiS-like domain-containing protein n=1 Tax=Celeribacter marinus TaxID=1397108 RepID=A0A0N9ZNB7_9RHOB|nr:DUF1127 domain-containing protein [Celeribacter marinus]ALI54924.1 hypothetical protein IMCC12053_976 [Celeribacter marinus]SFK02003.1 Uncharacterized conserved protein YjiS, DUF1127 family [Celeribacter marinus]
MHALTISHIRGRQRTPSLLSRLRTARTVARQRKSLAALDDRMLQDIGRTRAEATTEAARPAWDVPAHWTS